MKVWCLLLGENMGVNTRRLRISRCILHVVGLKREHMLRTFLMFLANVSCLDIGRQYMSQKEPVLASASWRDPYSEVSRGEKVPIVRSEGIIG